MIPRIRSRLSDKDIVTNIRITAPDYRPLAKQFDEDGLFGRLADYNDKRFETFDIFSRLHDEQKNLKDALLLAQEFAHNLSGWLVLIGVHGCGKTHLGSSNS